MAIVIASHKVKDFALWKPFFDGDIKRRQEMGVREIKQGQKADDPNEVYFIWEVKDPAKFQAGAQDPGLRAIMDKSGVIGDLHVIFLNEF